MACIFLRSTAYFIKEMTFFRRLQDFSVTSFCIFHARPSDRLTFCVRRGFGSNLIQLEGKIDYNSILRQRKPSNGFLNHCSIFDITHLIENIFT